MSHFLPNLVEAAEKLLHREKTCLPRDEGQGASRAQELARKQAQYRFNYTHVSPLAICDTIPVHDEFSFGWLKLIVERVLVALANRAELEAISELRDYHVARHRLVTSLFAGGLDRVREIRQVAREALRLESRMGASREHAEGLEDYAALFRTIGLPGIARNFTEDAVFAELRVAGPNPVMLRRLTGPDERLPLTEALFQVGAPGDSLAAAFAEARVYLADYALLDGAEAGNYPNGQKYLAAPLAVFVVHKATGRLQPVAIQCHQRPGPGNPLFTPRDGWNWMIAKTFVEIADGNVHEALTHLGRTHLSMEPFVV
ncbi:MAG: lipoxygenase family protein, partial [Planctomycetaceae bacterium]